ncbi:MAG: hypothetical protein ABJB22_06475, partial [Verrucomicrobiota bacterium]
MSDAYRVAPIFLIRMAGASFETVEHLSTRATSSASRELLVRQRNFADAKEAAEKVFAHRISELSDDAFRSWRAAIRQSRIPAESTTSHPAEFKRYADELVALTSAGANLEVCLAREVAEARTRLLHSAREILPRYLVFSSGDVQNLFSGEISDPQETIRPRNNRAGQRERHLLLYLQRIAAKNDTFSEFGPSSWGTIDPKVSGVRPASDPREMKREAFLERWTAHSASAALNADPEVRAEISPRLNPNGRIEGENFIFADSGEVVSLDTQTLKALSRCDGRTPAHSLGVSREELERLALSNVLRWEMEVTGLEPHAFAILVKAVAEWRPGPVRDRWLGVLRPIADSAEQFAVENDASSRIQIMQQARERLDQLGIARKLSDRSLYSAGNPIGEECFRKTDFAISETLAAEFVADAEPWIDLWRDCYAFVAGRVAAGLRKLFETAPVKNGAVALPAFLRHCATQKMPLTGHGLVALAHVAFQEVKVGFQKQLSSRADASEWQLTADDCRFVRDNFQYEKFDQYTYPSADLQIAATSMEDLARGDYEWILGELHTAVALLHHCFYWSCPDHGALSQALASTVFQRPNFHFGLFAGDFTSHTTVRIMEALPDLTYFVAAQRGKGEWRTVPPAEAEVYVDEQTADVCLRKRGSKDYLGSFARAWVIPLGFHPFQFGRAPHMPRLRCGKVIVQRRAWTVTQAELGSGDFTGVSRDLVLAVERLRAERDLPRFVYIRPTEQALRRSG